MTTTAITDKSIRYDRQARDFAAYLNGEYIGSFSTHAAAEAALDQVAYDQLADGVALTAAELDGGSDADECAEDVAAAVVEPAYEYCPGCGEIYCECDDDDYGDALAESAQGAYNGYCGRAADVPTDKDARAADVPTDKDARALLGAINTAHRNGLDTTGTRAWLAGYGYRTVLSGGVWVPDDMHRWHYVVDQRAPAAA